VTQCHGPLLIVVGIVLPAKGDVSIGDVRDAVIGNRNAVCVAGEIVQDVLRPSEGSFRIDHPIFAEQRAQERAERRRRQACVVERDALDRPQTYRETPGSRPSPVRRSSAASGSTADGPAISRRRARRNGRADGAVRFVPRYAAHSESRSPRRGALGRRRFPAASRRWPRIRV